MINHIMNMFKTTAFPWWYNALLSRHMSGWLIKILENPILIATGAGIFFVIKITTFGYLSSKLIKERKKNRELQAEYHALMEKYKHVVESNLQQQAINKSLTTLIASILPHPQSPTSMIRDAYKHSQRPEKKREARK